MPSRTPSSTRARCSFTARALAAKRCRDDVQPDRVRRGDDDRRDGDTERDAESSGHAQRAEALEDAALELRHVVADRAAAQLGTVEHEVVVLRGDRERVAVEQRFLAGSGAVNGWCENVISPVSSSRSNSGKPSTQQNANFFGSRRPSRSPISRRSRPATSEAAPEVSPTNRIASPSCAPVRSRSFAASASSTKRAIEPFTPSAANDTYARPFAPNDLASSVTASKSRRDSDAPPGQRKRDHAVRVILREPGEQPERAAAEQSATSTNSSSKRRSGLSEPKRRIASAYVRRGSGSAIVSPEHALPNLAHAAFHHRDDVVLLHERHLDVDLRELRLAVGALVLVAEAARDLHVAPEAADHQNLLEDLRRLRQRVERAGVHRGGTR